MISWLLQFGLLALLSIALMSRAHLDPKCAPRDAARARWRSWRGWAILAFCLYLASIPWQTRDPFFIALMTACAMWYLWQMLTHTLPNDGDAMWNYFYDPGHCGQCGYDVRQTVQGVCPECGWTVPASPAEVRLERRSWTLWWRAWRIDYLANWRQTRAQKSGEAGFVGAVLVLMLILRNGTMSALYAWMILDSMINLVRVQQYGRREMPQDRQEASSNHSVARQPEAAAVQPLEGRRS
jgi:hypothetical protein